MLTAAWFTPLAVGGMILALAGGFVLHVLPGRVLLIISGVGYVLSVLLFALIPARSESASGELEPSLTFLYWSYVFPAMCCGTIGVDIAFNVTNIFITTATPARLQATAGAVVNSLLYLGMAFWLGIGDLAVATAANRRGGEGSVEALDARSRYRIGFWTAVGLAAVALCLTCTVNLGKAAAEMTADEKAVLEQDLIREAAAPAQYPLGNISVQVPPAPPGTDQTMLGTSGSFPRSESLEKPYEGNASLGVVDASKRPS